jgi:Icc-related predicted phosphoesterase
MKFLITSDHHYNLKQFDWLEKVSGDFDGLIIAGDLLNIGSNLDLNVQILVISKYLKRISDKTQLLVCSGNHDGNEKNDSNEFIAPWLKKLKSPSLHVDCDNIGFDDYFFTIFPWWDGKNTKAELSNQFVKANKVNKKHWIWIYHSPPENSPTSWNGKRFIGDDFLNKCIEEYEPLLVITGHIHESPFKPDGSWFDKIGKTHVINAGNYISDIPPHMILDTDNMNIEWHSLAGSETLEMNRL